MIDTTRALRVVGSGLLNRDGPARLISEDNGDLIVRLNDGFIGTFRSNGTPLVRIGGATKVRLENEPIRKTTRMYARRSANGKEIRLQENLPLAPIGQIEIDIENNRIVAARVVS